MADDPIMTDQDPIEEATRHSRRRLLRRAAGGAGFLALAGSGALTIRQATAKDDDDDDDDDNSGAAMTRGWVGDDDDNSGHGGGGDDDETVITGEIPPVDRGPDRRRRRGRLLPGQLTVDLGQSVTFVNADHHDHTATGSGFDTGIMQPGQTATVVLDRPGTFAYACQIHPEMTGSIGVRDENGEVPAPSQSAATADATPCRSPTSPSIRRRSPSRSGQPSPGPTTMRSRTPSPPTDGAFDSGIFDPGGSFAWEFATPGTFPYRCNLHPQMEGTVEVTGDAPAPQDDARLRPHPNRPRRRRWSEPGCGADTGPDAGLGPQQAAVTFHDDGTLEAVYAAPTDARRAGSRSPSVPRHGTWSESGDGGVRRSRAVVLLDDEQRLAGTLTHPRGDPGSTTPATPTAAPSPSRRPTPTGRRSPRARAPRKASGCDAGDGDIGTVAATPDARARSGRVRQPPGHHPRLLLRSDDSGDSRRDDRHLDQRRRRPPHRDGRGRLVRHRATRRGPGGKPHLRPAGDLRLRLRFPPPDGGIGDRQLASSDVQTDTSSRGSRHILPAPASSPTTYPPTAAYVCLPVTTTYRYVADLGKCIDGGGWRSP